MCYSAKKIPVTCSVDTVNDWAAFINDHLDEARQSLKQEGVELEQWFLGTDGPKIFLVGVMKTSDTKRAGKVASTSSLEVDKYHRKFKRYWMREQIRDLSVEGASAPNFPDLKLILDIHL